MRSGVAGWWQIDLAAHDGTLAAPVPTFSGLRWDQFFTQHDLDSEPVLPILSWSLTDREHYYIAVLLFVQLVERLTKDAVHGSGWVRISGDGSRLLRPSCDVREALAAVVPAGVTG